VTDTPTEREDVGPWANLRRRKVVQWGLAYSAAAWALLQVTGFLADAFHWPDATKQVAAIGLLFGLPVALTLAWYHGDKGEQRVSRTELAVLTLLLLLAGAVLGLYAQRSPPPPASATARAPAVRAPPTATATDARPSIAVLPFENRSDAHGDAYFVDGIHDDILTQLSKVSALKVISRTSVEQFRDTRLPTKAIAEQLGVKSILEGAVQRSGNRVRINVQLIDAGTDAHLWAESYDRELTAANIFAIQSDVAAAIAGALQATLTSGEKARVSAVPTQNLESWEAYQLGRQRMAKRTSEALLEAERFFDRAIQLDPRFAQAYAGLAETLALQIGYSGAPRTESLAKAETAAGKALQLDPSLAEAWSSSAYIAEQKSDNDRARRMYGKAIALNPNYSTAYLRFSSFLRGLGRTEEALALAEKAAELDPLSALMNFSLANALEARGRYGEADARDRRVIEIDPAMPASYSNLGIRRATAQGRIADAVPLLEKAVELDSGNPQYPTILAQLYLDLGSDAQANRYMATARAKWPANESVNMSCAFASLYRGDEDASVQYAQRAADADPRSGALELLAYRDLQRDEYTRTRRRYAEAYPELFLPAPRVDGRNLSAAIGVVPALQKAGDPMRAMALLDGSEQYIRAIPRLGPAGYWIADAQIHALRGDKARALAALRDAERAGWRMYWRYVRDFDPGLASIRNEPEFKAVFADIERDMARQRAELAARPKDAPLDLATVH
jgi:TolB-like protein